ncbi:MAG: hypothetical protein CMO55_11430 [Verrucomicrobiales bacterium]|nr:hypothetical protein [Verrucomicrobiales bacterium]
MDLLLAAETQWEFSKDGTLQSFSRLARPTPKTVWRQQESSDDQDKTIEVKIRERWIKLNIRFEDGFLISRTPGAEKEIPGHPSYMAFRKLHPESDASPQSAEQDDDGN